MEGEVLPLPRELQCGVQQGSHTKALVNESALDISQVEVGEEGPTLPVK